MAGKKQYKRADNQLSMFNDLNTPSMPVLDVSRCQARVINYETAARMVETYHYAHRVPSITVAIGMYVDGILAGCLTYGMPPGINVQKVCGEDYKDNCLELNRLYIHEWAGRNSESWLIGQSFKLLNIKQYFILVSYADTTQGHLGKIYQATNWLYTGETDERAVGYLINGREHHDKTLYNIIGSSSSEKVLEYFPTATKLTQLGKHRYVYFLGDRRQRRVLRQALKWPVLPYPKNGEKLSKNGMNGWEEARK